MRKSFLSVAILSIALSAVVLPKVQGQDFYNVNNKPYYIEVTGTASKEVAPDKIFLEIVINENDYKNESLANKERSMLKELEAIGIDTKKDLVIKDMMSNFRRYFIKGNEVKLSKEYELLVSSAAKAGEVIGKLQSIGISNVSVGKVENSKIESYKDEARAEAAQNARHIAEQITAAIGQEIGKAVYISEYSYSNSDYGVMKVRNTMALGADMAFEEVAADMAPEIEFENITIKTSITAHFELK